MGADLIAYSIVVPRGKANAFVKKEVSRLKKVFAKVNEGTAKHIIDKMGLSQWDYENDLGIEFGEEGFERTKALRDEVARDLEAAENFREQTGARDAATHFYTIGRRKVTLIFAGEMSWGDTPDGTGYQAIRALYRLGIGKKLLRMVEK